MSERPSSAQKTVSIDHPMKWKIQIGRRSGDGPAHLPGATGITQCPGDVAVARYPTSRNLAHNFEDLIGKPFGTIMGF
jgi:hypothetical protein